MVFWSLVFWVIDFPIIDLDVLEHLLPFADNLFCPSDGEAPEINVGKDLIVLLDLLLNVVYEIRGLDVNPSIVSMNPGSQV